jgi:hypothetical protein
VGAAGGGREVGEALGAALAARYYVVENDPTIGGEELRQGGQSGKQVRLVNCAAPARWAGTQ